MTRIGVVGATGLVGSKIIDILGERRFPLEQLRLFASARSAGSKVAFHGDPILVENAADADFSDLDIVLMSAGGDTSRALAEKIADDGGVVIDNSSAWRMDNDVPLVVAEVNPDALADIPKRIIANPNCTTMIAMPVLSPLHKRYGLVSLWGSSYQAVSGSGIAGVQELASQVTGIDDITNLADHGNVVPGELYVRPIAFNAVPIAGNLIDDETDEEKKFRNESRKILGLPNLAAQMTCVRVPVVTGHSLTLCAEFERDVDLTEVRNIVKHAAGVQLVDVPNPLEATGIDDVLVGRLRKDESNSRRLYMFVSGDNLRKGAALNAVQIAELLHAGV